MHPPGQARIRSTEASVCRCPQAVRETGRERMRSPLPRSPRLWRPIQAGVEIRTPRSWDDVQAGSPKRRGTANHRAFASDDACEFGHRTRGARARWNRGRSDEREGGGRSRHGRARNRTRYVSHGVWRGTLAGNRQALGSDRKGAAGLELVDSPFPRSDVGFPRAGRGRTPRISGRARRP